MKLRRNILVGDKALWVIFFLLSGISLIAVYSTIGYSAIIDLHSTPLRIFFKHLVFVLGAYACIILVSHVNYRRFSAMSVWLFVIAVGLLLVAAIVGTRWLSVGLFSFQPSELAKLALIVFLARTIVHNRERLDDRSTLIAMLVPVALVCGLVLPENLSTGVLIFAVCYLMLYFGGIDRRRWWRGCALLLALAVGGFLFLYLLGDKIDMFRSTTWNHRLHAWFNPDPDELTQENMARMAVARGGLFFRNGIGTTIHGRLMTQAHNDFIFAIIIEEAGALVGAFIFLLYAWFYFRCMRIASRCRGLFGSLCVAGLGTSIFLQALLNMAVGVGALPVTGQTLPFISYGGTSYLVSAAGIGVIQAVAADNRRGVLSADPQLRTIHNSQFHNSQFHNSQKKSI